MRILLIEDELKVAAFIKKGLTENSYNVTVAYDSVTGKSMALQEDFDLILLDVMLPAMNGFELCRQLRAEHIKAPILMLTALSSIDDKIEGFQKGADDYLVKPFHFKELLARIQAQTRRRDIHPYQKTVLTFADIDLDSEKKIAKRNGKDITLTAKEYALLELFMKNNNKVLSRNFIADQIWGYSFDASSNVIDVYINYLRKKIEKGFSTKLIHTVVGMGYIMKEG